MFLREDGCHFSCHFWEHGFNERSHIKLEHLRGRNMTDQIEEVNGEE